MYSFNYESQYHLHAQMCTHTENIQAVAPIRITCFSYPAVSEKAVARPQLVCPELQD